MKAARPERRGANHAPRRARVALLQRALLTLCALGAAALLAWMALGARDARTLPGAPRATLLADEVRDGEGAAHLGGVERALDARAEAEDLTPTAARSERLDAAFATTEGRFEVRVVDDLTGGPIADATLTLTTAALRPGVVRSPNGDLRLVRVVATTDDDGRATLDARFTRGDLAVASPRYVDVARPDVGAGALVSVRLTASGALVGRVDLPGRALLEAPEVQLWTGVDAGGGGRGRGRGRSRGRPELSVPLAANGTFRFDDLAPGFVTVAVASEEVALLWEPSITIESGLETSVTLRAAPTLRLTGRVVDDEARRPLAGVVVLVRPDLQGASSSLESIGRAHATSGPDGAFTLEPLSPGRYFVTVATEFGARVEREVVVSADAAPLELRVPTPVEVTGRVLDSLGRPVAGASVALARAEDAGRGDWALPEGEDPGAIRGAFATIESAPGGYFRFARAPADARLVIGALHRDPTRGVAFGASEVRTRRASAPPDEVLVRTRFTARVVGLVVDSAGAPVRAVDVRADTRQAGARVRTGQATTDASGRFELVAPDGDEARLGLRAAGFLDRSVEVALPAPRASDGARVLSEPLVLERELMVHGLVRDEDGNAIAGAAVRLMEVVEDNAARRVGRSNDHGRFTVGGLTAGEWRLEAWAEGHRRLTDSDPAGESRLTVHVPSEDALTLVLARAPSAPRGAAAGELVAFGTDEPVLGLRFDGLGDGSLVLEGERFRALGLAVGATRFVVSAPGFERLSLPEFTVEADRTTELGRVELRPATRLAIHVEDAAGVPVRGADVRLDRLPEARAGRGGLPRRLAVPAVRGGPEYRLQEAPRARWRLAVDHPEAGRYRGELQVDGARQAVTVRLVPR